MITLTMTLLAVERVGLVKGDEPASLAAPGLWVVAIACLTVLLLAALLAWRVRRQQDPRTSAFRLLARRLGVSRAGRAILERLALSHGAASPVALLLSTSALYTAIRALDASTLPRRERRALDRLRQELAPDAA